MRFSNIALIVAIVLLVGVGIYLIASQRQALVVNTSPSPTIEQSSPPAGEVSSAPTILISPTTSSNSSITLTVEGSEFNFSPQTITVSSGSTIKIIFENKGTIRHNFTIPDLNVSTSTIAPGQTTTVKFIPSKTGSFPFFCSVDNHRNMGMQGTFTVK